MDKIIGALLENFKFEERQRKSKSDRLLAKALKHPDFLGHLLPSAMEKIKSDKKKWPPKRTFEKILKVAVEVTYIPDDGYTKDDYKAAAEKLVREYKDGKLDPKEMGDHEYQKAMRKDRKPMKKEGTPLWQVSKELGISLKEIREELGLLDKSHFFKISDQDILKLRKL